MKWRSFLSGCLVTLLAVGLIGTAAATVGRRTVEVDYNNIKVTLDGQQVALVDANGSPVEPFAINGTTYLPIRAVATALGLDISWDATTSTAVLTTPQNQTDTAAGTVIYNENGVTVTYLGLEKGAEYEADYKVKLQIKNGSDRDLTVQVRDVSVNDVMVDPVFSCDVVAGKTANDSIKMYNLADYGVPGAVEKIELKFHFFNSNDWMDSFDSGVITVK